MFKLTIKIDTKFIQVYVFPYFLQIKINRKIIKNKKIIIIKCTDTGIHLWPLAINLYIIHENYANILKS